MICFKRKKVNLGVIFTFLFFNSFIYSTELLKGDENAAADKTFSFPIGKSEISSRGDLFYVTSHSTNPKGGGQVGEFTLVRVHRSKNTFEPLALKQVSIDGQGGQDNPLFDTGVNHFSLLENSVGIERTINYYPILVTADNPSAIYLVDISRYPSNAMEVLQSVADNECELKKKQQELSKKIAVAVEDKINDANGKLTSGIESLETAGKGYVFAAVKNNNGDAFGAPGSGIAFVALISKNVGAQGGQTKSKDEVENNGNEEKKEKREDVQDANKANKEDVKKEDSRDNEKEDNLVEEDKAEENKAKKVILDLMATSSAVPLDKTSDVAKIGSDLESIKVVDMHWDRILGRLYIALQVESENDVNDGCKAIVVGRVIESQDKISFLLKDIAIDNVFSGQNKIIGAVGSQSKVSLHKVRTMLTSTRLHYLIVLGSNGEPDGTKKSVYALPLVSNRDDQENHGMLAKKNAEPVDSFEGCNIQMLRYRSLQDPATQSSQLLTSGDAAAQVGAGDLEAGDIAEIFVVGDSVFAVVDVSSDVTGIFMSQALFDDKGRIKRWTQWQRVANADLPIFGGALDAKFGNFITTSGDAENNVKTVKRGQWSTGAQDGLQDLSDTLNQEFPKEIAGIQGLFEFPNYKAYNKNGPVDSDLGLKNITLLVATGLKKIALVELAKIQGGVLVRNTGDFSSGKVNFAEGKITSNFPVNDTKVVVVSGGVLDDLGPIEASAVTFEGSGRLFVAGVGGLAVLVDSTNGQGWDISQGLGPKFAGLTDKMVFKKIGDFSFVRKLVAEDKFLYVLTDKALYRIDLENSNFLTGNIDFVMIASHETIDGMNECGTLLDFAFSGKLGLLATSVGLFRVGNGKDISLDNELDWTHIEVPSYVGPIRQLLPISQTLREQDFAKEDTDGVLYILGAYHGKSIAQFNRFTVNYSSGVDENTIVPFSDFFFQNSVTGQGAHSYFVNFGTFRKLLKDEGALRFSARDRDMCNAPFLKLLPPNHIFRLVLPIVSSQMVPLSIDNDSDIVKVLRSSTGPILVAGDFGLKVNE